MRGRPARLERFGQQDQFLAAAAAELHDRAVGPAQRRDDRAGVPRQQRRLGARDPIPRQPADRLEQAGAERVVQVLRLQLLRCGRQVAPDVGGELCRQGIDDPLRHRDAAVRNFAYTYG
jgi:hypothetical protein